VSTLVAPGVRLLDRAESGLPADVGGATGAPQDVLRVHHGASQNVAGLDACRRVVQAYNQLHRNDNGWSDIGYSFLVGRGDSPEEAWIFTGRGWGRWGAHTLGHNDDLGVCFIGNGGDPSVITPAVKRAYVWLRSARHDGARPAFGHRDTSQTACPGDALYAWVKAGLPISQEDDVTEADKDDIARKVCSLLLGDRSAGLRNQIRLALDEELGDESGAGALSDRIADKVAAKPVNVDALASAVADKIAARLAQ
jgi:hypothetical protein